MVTLPSFCRPSSHKIDTHRPQTREHPFHQFRLRHLLWCKKGEHSLASAISQLMITMSVLASHTQLFPTSRVLCVLTCSETRHSCCEELRCPTDWLWVSHVWWWAPQHSGVHQTLPCTRSHLRWGGRVLFTLSVCIGREEHPTGCVVVSHFVVIVVFFLNVGNKSLPACCCL